MNFDINTLSMLAGMMGGKNPNSGASGGMPQNGAMLETLMKLVSGMNGNAAGGFNNNGNGGGANNNGNGGGANNMLSVLPMLMSLLGTKGANKPSSDGKSSVQNCEVNEKTCSDEQNNDLKTPRGNYENNSDVSSTRRQYDDYSRHSSRNRFGDIEFAGAEVSYIMAKLLRTANYEKR